MKKLTVLLLFAFAVSCQKDFPVELKDLYAADRNAASKVIIAKGTIEKQGITTYQYGTHVLFSPGGGAESYALRSSKANLDYYINKVVEIKGAAIEGYPVSGGPVYVEVIAVTEIE